MLKELDEEVKVLLQGVQVTNVNSHSLGIIGIRKNDGKLINHIMIPKNTPIPVERTEPFGIAAANQVTVQIKVVEGESDNPDECTEIGLCELKDLPAGLKTADKIDVTYRYKPDGRLEVTGRHRGTGKEAKVEIIRSTGMDDREIKDAQDSVIGIEVG